MLVGYQIILILSKNQRFIESFLAFSDNDCSNNVEFSEWGNELLFQIMDKYQLLFYSTLFSLSNKGFSSVKKEVLNPVNDGINVIAIFKRLKKSKLEKSTKKKAIGFLKPTYLMQKKEIEDWEKKNYQKWQWSH